MPLPDDLDRSGLLAEPTGGDNSPPMSVGELSGALRNGTRAETELEFADVLAWLVTLANCKGIDLEDAIGRKYGKGCPGCGGTPCTCGLTNKP